MSVRASALLLGAGLALIASGLGLGMARVWALETSELAHEGEARPLAGFRDGPGASTVSARLASVALRAGERAVFEVCWPDGMDREVFEGALGFAVFKLEPMSLMLRVDLDAAHMDAVRDGHGAACLTLGSGAIDEAGRYSVDAVWPDGPPPAAALSTPVRARILARAELDGGDRALVLTAALGCLLTLLSGFLWPATRAGDAPAAGRGPVVAGLIGVAVLFGIGQLPLWGSTLGMAKGALMAATQVALALSLGRLTGPGAGWHPPARPVGHAAAAVVTAGLLVASARLSLRVVPSTGEAPIETFISWPSGMLAFAVLGVVLPAAEELFFRGFLYRAALQSLGRAGAFVLTVALFTALHAPQIWGNWGALLAIFSTGVLLTALRAWTGSVLPCALAHVLYNLTLSLRSLG